MTDQDAEHLKLLSIFHFVVAGLAALFSLFAVPHLVIASGLASGALDGDDPAAKTVGVALAVFAGAWILLGLAFGVLLALAGSFLTQRRHYMFCFVMACVACAFMPFGTVLGVFTIVVLSRESVKDLFGVVSAESAVLRE